MGPGLPVEDPADGSGVDLITGVRREWTYAPIDPPTTRGVAVQLVERTRVR